MKLIQRCLLALFAATFGVVKAATTIYVDSGVAVPLRPERILTSTMIPLAAMQQKTVETGKSCRNSQWSFHQ